METLPVCGGFNLGCAGSWLFPLGLLLPRWVPVVCWSSSTRCGTTFTADACGWGKACAVGGTIVEPVMKR